MDPRHSHRGSMKPFIASMTLSLAAASSCASPDDGELAGLHAGSTHQPISTESASSFTLFESGQVRPLALSPDRRHLFAVNTPDNRLEVFRVYKDHLVRKASIPVGLEPVAVAARTNGEVWVVNHLSDSVSIVELDDECAGGHVQRTLLVGDEPRDIVFAGPD